MNSFESYLARESYRLFMDALPDATATMQFVWTGPMPDLRLFVERAGEEMPWMRCDRATVERVNAAIIERLMNAREEQERTERMRRRD